MQRCLNNAMRRITTFAIGLLLYAVALPVHAATITVTNTNDSGPGSLRQALAVAHDGDRITFAVSGTITLTSGGLVVTKNVTISGPGANELSIDGNQGPSVFSVDTIATISGLAIRNGFDGIENPGTLTVSNCVLSGNSRDGIFNTGILTVSNCVLSGNSAGGIFNAGTLTVSNCDLSGNSSDGIGNDALSSGPASLTVVNSNVSDNGLSGIFNSAVELGVVTATIRSTTVSGNSAGGVVTSTNFSRGNVFITDCTISGNSAGGIVAGVNDFLSVANSTINGNSGTNGGGITVSGLDPSSSIVNTTVSGNSAGTSGGGIAIREFNASLRIANSTITGNSAPSGGGIYIDGQFGVSVVEISNTILNAGALGANIFNGGGTVTVTSQGYNLSSDNASGYLTGPGDQINTDPLLGPLQNNGGPTFTHALLPGSPAIDTGDPNFSPPPFNDQRGCPFDRVFNGRIDIGSLETQPPRRPCPTPRPRPTTPPRP
jgi:hypothetical protein